MNRFPVGFPFSSVGSSFLELQAEKDALSMTGSGTRSAMVGRDACCGCGWGKGSLCLHSGLKTSQRLWFCHAVTRHVPCTAQDIYIFFGLLMNFF